MALAMLILHVALLALLGFGLLVILGRLDKLERRLLNNNNG